MFFEKELGGHFEALPDDGRYLFLSKNQKMVDKLHERGYNNDYLKTNKSN